MSRVVEGRNSATPKEAASHFEPFDQAERRREEKLAALDADFKAKKRAVNKEINAEQKGILADAKNVGIAKGIIRELAAKQKMLRKAKRMEENALERLDNLEDDDREYAVSIEKALGEDFLGLPLGKAAKEREEPSGPDETTAAIVDAVSKDEAAKGGKTTH